MPDDEPAPPAATEPVAADSAEDCDLEEVVLGASNRPLQPLNNRKLFVDFGAH